MTIYSKPGAQPGRTAFAALAAVALLAGASGAAAAGAKGKAASIEGSWKVTNVVITGANPVTIAHPQDNLAIYSHGRYVSVGVTGDKARTASAPAKDPAKLTDAEKLARFDEWGPVAAQAGTYEVKGDKLIRTPTVAKSVAAVAAGAYEADMKLTADTLVVTTHAAAGQPPRDQTLTLTRVK